MISISTHKLHTWTKLWDGLPSCEWIIISVCSINLDLNLKVDFFHVSEEWSQWATTIWKLEPILKVNFLHMNEESFQKKLPVFGSYLSQILMEFAQIWLKIKLIIRTTSIRIIRTYYPRIIWYTDVSKSAVSDILYLSPANTSAICLLAFCLSACCPDTCTYKFPTHLPLILT